MTHTSPDGAAKLVPSCTLPLTALQSVKVVITDLAIFRFIEGQLTLTGLMPGVGLDEVRAKTEAAFVTALD